MIYLRSHTPFTSTVPSGQQLPVCVSKVPTGQQLPVCVSKVPTGQQLPVGVSKKPSAHSQQSGSLKPGKHWPREQPNRPLILLQFSGQNAKKVKNIFLSKVTSKI